MAGTVFNIFGETLQESRTPRINPFSGHENVNVAKSGLLNKNATPLKVYKDISTPLKQTQLKKKTFLQNEGMSLQMFCPKNMDSNRKKIKTFEKPVVYEDEKVKSPKKSYETIDIEFSYKPIFYEENDDDEFIFSEEQMNHIIFGSSFNIDANNINLESPRMQYPIEFNDPLSDILEEEYYNSNDFCIENIELQLVY